MIVLDSNVISELMKAVPSPAVLAWLDAQNPDDTCTTAVSVYEVRQGIAVLPAGKRQRDLMAAFDEVVRIDLGGRVRGKSERQGDGDDGAGEQSG